MLPPGTYDRLITCTLYKMPKSSETSVYFRGNLVGEKNDQKTLKGLVYQI